jgi:hypothetical protein
MPLAYKFSDIHSRSRQATLALVATSTRKKIFAMPACVVVWLTARLDWLPFKVIGSYFI